MGRCRGAVRAMAKEAIRRMTAGFWAEEYAARSRRLTLAARNGKDKAEAVKFFIAETKGKLKRENQAEDETYLRVRRLFLSGAEEKALSVLIDREKLDEMDDSGRQRYIFDLSNKLAEYRKRFNKEQEYGLHETAICV